jgi:hypothetical protein
MPKIGDERFVVSMIDVRNVEALARKQGWPGGVEGLREFCEPEDAAKCTAHKTLDDATDMARKFLASGQAFYGSVLIDREVYEEAHDDRGNRVRCPPSWESQQLYEVAMDGERIEVDA